MPLKRSTARCAAGILVCLVSLLSGCAHTLVYDENRDKQGQAAVKAVEEAHLASTVESMSKAFADMAAREEANARRRAEQYFEWEMVRASGAKTLDEVKVKGKADTADGLATTARSRLKELGLADTSPKNLDTLAAMPAILQEAIEAFENTRTTFRGGFGIQFADCTSVYAASADASAKSDVAGQGLLKRIAPAKQADATAKFQQLVSDCTSIDLAATNWQGLFAKGTINELAAELDTRAREELTYQAEKAKATAALAAARDAAKPVIEQAKPGEPKLAEVEAQATKILGIIAQARQVNDIAGAEVLAADKLDHLEQLLNSIAGEPGDDKVKLSADELLTVRLARDLPGLRDEAKKLFAEAAQPRLVPFVAAIEYQKRVLENIEAIHAVDRKELDLRRAQLRAALDESVALANVLKPIEKHGWGDKSIPQVNAQPDTKLKQEFYAALGTYGDEVRKARVEQAVLGSRAAATTYERNFVNSRYAAAHWDALMDMSAKVLADYHAAGIKTADIAEFLQALGLVAVGIGVAQ